MKIKDIMTKDVVTADKDTHLSTVLNLMEKHGISKLPATEDGEVVGIIGDGHIADELGSLKSAGKPASALHASSVMQREFHALTPDTDVSELRTRFTEENGLGLFPVLFGENLVGVVTKADLLGLVEDQTPLEQFMVQELHSVEPEDRVVHARRIMLDEQVERLPVIAEGKVVGVITEMDLAFGFARFRDQVPANHQENQIRNFLVEDVMERRVVTAPPSMPAQKAAQRMLDEDVGCLPVVDASGTIQGMVTRSDLIDLT